MTGEQWGVVTVVAMWSVLVGTFAAIGGRFFERRKWEQRFAELTSALRTSVATDPERMERLENAVDAIAVELERVGEGQRFVTKVIADRASSPRSPIPGSVSSPKPPTS